VKLLVVSPHFRPRFEGGTEVVARAQALALAEQGHDVRVVAGCDTPHRGDDVERETVDGLPVAFLPRLPDEPYDLLLERPRLRMLVEQQAAGVDAVHLHGWATLAGDLVQALASRARVVVSLHDLFVTCPRFFRLPVGGVTACPPRGEYEPCVRCVAPDAPGVPAEVLASGLAARARRFQTELDAAHAVVLPSDAQRTRLESLVTLAPDRTHVLPHGLVHEPPDAEVLRGAAVAWDGRGPLRVLFLGNLTAVKGVLDLAEAAGRVAAGGCALELVLAGAAVEEGVVEALRTAAGSARLHLLGRYDPSTLPARLASLGGCHLAALPSRAHESYGLVVDEALALGLPTWVSDRGAPQERVGAAGRVLPAADAAALAVALESAYDDPAALARERSAAGARYDVAAATADRLAALLGG